MIVDRVVRWADRTLAQIVEALDHNLSARDNFAPEGTRGQVLTSNGLSAVPSYQDIPGADTSGLASADHDHDERYYTEPEVDQLLSDFYTESEVDALLATKAAVGHDHDDRTDDGATGAAKTIDWSVEGAHRIELTANTTLTFDNPVTGAVHILEVQQDATGGRTITWPASVRWPSGTAPTLTATASRADVFTFYYNGTYFLGVTAGQNYTLA